MLVTQCYPTPIKYLALLEINQNYKTATKKIINKCRKHFRASGAKLSLIIVSVKMSSRTRKLRQDVMNAVVPAGGPPNLVRIIGFQTLYYIVSFNFQC